MEYARAPLDCIKTMRAWGREQEIIDALKSLACTTRIATPEDIARMQPPNTITFDICAEMGLIRTPEKKPKYPFELGLNRAERSQHI